MRELAKTEGLYQVSKFHLSAIRPLWIPSRGTGVPGRTARYGQLHKACCQCLCEVCKPVVKPLAGCASAQALYDRSAAAARR